MRLFGASANDLTMLRVKELESRLESIHWRLVNVEPCMGVIGCHKKSVVGRCSVCGGDVTFDSGPRAALSTYRCTSCQREMELPVFKPVERREKGRK